MLGWLGSELLRAMRARERVCDTSVLAIARIVPECDSCAFRWPLSGQSRSSVVVLSTGALSLPPLPAASLLARIAASMLLQLGALTLAQETQFSELPWDFVALVFLRLPLDARLRAREVSRGWRALLNEPRFWTVLDFSPGSGVVAWVTRALLFAAGERGRGHLHTLDHTGSEGLHGFQLEEFVAAHGQSLRSVTASEWCPLSANNVTSLCRSASLCTLRCHVNCDAAEALPLLRCEAPCALLHIFKLWVHTFNNEQAVLDLAAALPSHNGRIKKLTVRHAPLQTGAVVDALMRSIAEARVSDLTILGNLAPASLLSITRLLQAGCLERLCIRNSWHALFEAGPDLTAFCHALRSSTLQTLRLDRCYLWRHLAAAGELLAALVGHQTLRELSLSWYRAGDTDDARRAGEQLASLITHNSALQKLELSGNQLGEVRLAPIFEELPGSSTLIGLLYSFSRYDTISREFACGVILPAVRANISLRRLEISNLSGTALHSSECPELAEAHAIVAARTQPDATAAS